MKKFLSAFLSALIVLSVMPLTVFAANGMTEGDYSYDVVSGEAHITEYLGGGGDVMIPPALGGCPVTVIGDYAFFDSGLTSITIPDSVASIGDRAFSSCSSMESIEVAEENPCYHSENNCLIETGSKTLIAGCNNSAIPKDGSVTSIGDSAFYASGLTGITIPDSVTSIGAWAFYNCSRLTGITIPDSVTSIGGEAFRGCVSLISIIIPEGITSIGNWVFCGCSALTSITIPEGVTSIGDYAFYSCRALTNITIPGEVTSIGDYAFGHCWNLINVTIPDSVISIGDGAFLACDELTIYTSSDYVKTYADNHNIACQALPVAIEIVQLPEKLVYIEGTEPLSTEGGKLKLHYDGFEKVIDITEGMVSGFDNTKVGVQMLTVAIGGKQTAFKVRILPKTPVAIEIVQLPKKLVYIEGTEPLSTEGGKLKLHYDGFEKVIDITEGMVSGFDNTKVGVQMLTIMYQGLTATFDIEIIRCGTGTEENPYLIFNKSQLNKVRNDLDAHYKLTADIRFSKEDFEEGGEFYNGGKGWEPIGTFAQPFSGEFNGEDHSIIGLYCNTSSRYVGLFGYNKGTVKNVGMHKSNIVVDCSLRDYKDYTYAGGIVGYNVC